MKTNVRFWSYLAQFFVEWEIFETRVVEEIKHTCNGKYLFFSENPANFLDNVGKYGRSRQATDGRTIMRMRIASWMTKTTNTHSEYVILIAFPLQTWLHERASMLRLYVRCLSRFFK
jgi:hypothetical protein